MKLCKKIYKIFIKAIDKYIKISYTVICIDVGEYLHLQILYNKEKML